MSHVTFQSSSRHAPLAATSKLDIFVPSPFAAPGDLESVKRERGRCVVGCMGLGLQAQPRSHGCRRHVCAGFVNR